MDSVLFVVNFDIDEHESTRDLERLLEKIKEELSLIRPCAELFSFSALLNLFKSHPRDLSPKDNLRFSQWEKELDFVDFSNRETENFKSRLEYQLRKERSTLLLANHLERLDVISSGIRNQIHLFRDIIARDGRDTDEIMEKFQHHQEKMNLVKSMVKTTLDGTVQKIKRELDNDIQSFFDFRTGYVFMGLLEFIRGYSIAFHQHVNAPAPDENDEKPRGFTGSLYLAFQEFKRSLDTFITEEINPEVIRFAREEETRIREHFELATGAFEAMLHDALSEYYESMKPLGIFMNTENREKTSLPDMNTMKGMASLALPPVSASMNYSAKIKTEAVLRLGYYNVAAIIRRLLRKPGQGKKQNAFLALKDGISRLKRETEKSILFEFKSYRENAKYQYFFKLADAVSNHLSDALMNRFQGCVSDLSRIMELTGKKQIDTKDVADSMKELVSASDKINEIINGVREKIELSD